MDKKEIDSPKLTANFIIWICGVGGLLLLNFLGSFRLENYMNSEKFSTHNPTHKLRCLVRLPGTLGAPRFLLSRCKTQNAGCHGRGGFESRRPAILSKKIRQTSFTPSLSPFRRAVRSDYLTGVLLQPIMTRTDNERQLAYRALLRKWRSLRAVSRSLPSVSWAKIAVTLIDLPSQFSKRVTTWSCQRSVSSSLENQFSSNTNCFQFAR